MGVKSRSKIFEYPESQRHQLCGPTLSVVQDETSPKLVAFASAALVLGVRSPRSALSFPICSSVAWST